ncbi:ABA4-like family protein [Sphingomicrobium aestuariivivum]|uniref:ABA4-like family protein n=1 Tax=Sphingomicrobium aestuariivivum TaxID=1582356 RepID=UPI001FD6637F|nr:ABA4-like family protein [Sphingomicrobium aestuariivivum]MCJ8190177.1 ABA4-like family protein [Sphingomicrobium aestuariivivum]
MDWETLFSIVVTGVFVPWIVLIAGPRGPKTHALIFYLGIGLLALAYSVVILVMMFSPGGIDWASLGTIEGVRCLFASDAGVTLGWIHYLAFDLFVGQWIAKDADHKLVNRWVQAPILFLTLMAGPLGLFIWMVVRERRARAMAGLKMRG